MQRVCFAPFNHNPFKKPNLNSALASRQRTDFVLFDAQTPASVNMACRDGSVSSNTALGPWCRRRIGDEQKFREKFDVFGLALDPDNGFRYPPVSLFFDMCLTFWDRRGV